MNRRNFMWRLTGNVALTAAMAEMAGVRARASMRRLEQAAGATADADFWATVRAEFLLDPHCRASRRARAPAAARPRSTGFETHGDSAARVTWYIDHLRNE